MPIITLPNGKKKIYKNAISLVKVVEDIKIGFSKFVVGSIINGKFVDINFHINKNCHIDILTKYDIRSINLFSYSCMQLLSYSLKKVWKTSKLGIGNINKNIFYCDIDLNYKLNKHDIIILENVMKKLIKKKYNIIFNNILFSELKNIFLSQNELYKLYYIKKKFFNNKYVPIYLHENFLDIYLGPQIPNINFCLHFKLKNIKIISREYGSLNTIFQRIYGQVWLNKEMMLSDLNKLKITMKKDHRNLNKKMNLYHKEKESPGMIFWHHNGSIIFRELENFIRVQLRKWNYEEVKTPFMLNQSLWKQSGHLENFYSSIFFTKSENQIYCIKPMNCPAHIKIFNKYLRSYKDLPLRIAEFGICHRNETSGSLYGLLRLNSFTQDDAHIFCTEDQVQSEIINCIKIIMDSYKIFGFKNIHVKFSTRPRKRIGSNIIWDKAELSLKNALIDSNIIFKCQKGEGAFYGPKIEFILEDCLNRLWQCGTIQLDFYLPDRFGSYYIDKNNNRKMPIMIHRAILGSIERFIGILLEEYSGNLPVWLSPIQVIIINVNSNHNQYVINLFKKLFQLNIRVKYDIKNEKINSKIRKYIILKIPYILICGDKEINIKKVSVRNRNNNVTKIMSIDNFIRKIKYEIKYHIL